MSTMEYFHCYVCNSKFYERNININSENSHFLNINKSETANLKDSNAYVWCKYCRTIIGTVDTEKVYKIQLSKTYTIARENNNSNVVLQTPI